MKPCCIRNGSYTSSNVLISSDKKCAIVSIPVGPPLKLKTKASKILLSILSNPNSSISKRSRECLAKSISTKLFFLTCAKSRTLFKIILETLGVHI